MAGPGMLANISTAIDISARMNEMVLDRKHKQQFTKEIGNCSYLSRQLSHIKYQLDAPLPPSPQFPAHPSQNVPTELNPFP